MQLVIKALAESDIVEMADFFDRQFENGGAYFLERLTALYLRLLDQPRLYQQASRCPRGREVRVGRAKPFEVIAFYEVTATEIVILSVVHARSRRWPWRQRL